MKLSLATCIAIVAALASASTVLAVTVVIDYEDLTEGPLGDPLSHMGVTYHDLNNVSGIFPDGETFGPQPDDEFILENAGLFYLSFPNYGSPVNALTFGIAYVPGENLTIGPLSTVTMDLDAPVTEASLDLAYYENGPWGGIEFHLDGISGGQVVAATSFTISDLGGRDNPAATTLAIAGPAFNQLHLYATYGQEYSMPRAMIDDLTLTYENSTPTAPTTWGRVKRLYR
jgi:hypothetical protein